jgi:protocatechuate 3,4-dioxygenase beta subunit
MSADEAQERTGPVATLTRRALVLAAPSLLVSGVAIAALAPTPGSTEGPFYPAQEPRDDDADLVRVEGAIKDAGGDILHLTGRVLDANAQAVAGARIEIWQCDANGAYLHPGERRRNLRDAGFQGFGHAPVDPAGRFAFRTIVPVPYPGRAPHIHVKVRHDGRTLLTTQLYRLGHRQNSADFLFRRLALEEQNRVLMAIRPRVASSRGAFETEIDLVIAT